MVSDKYNKFHFVLVLVVLFGGLMVFVLQENRVVAQNEIELNLLDQGLEYSDMDTSVVDLSSGEFDFENDNSIQRYLGNGYVLSDLYYSPEDLVSIDSNFTYNNSQKFKLREESASEFADLARHFWNHWNGDKLIITSAYRSPSFQGLLIKKGCSSARCAQVGASEHQLGLAIDLGVMTKQGRYVPLNKGNKYYQRLYDNADKRGFHNSYQNGIEIDGQMQEGRHWRYLGSGMASILHENNQTFAQRMSLNK